MATPIRTALFGGTFNPLHNGHIVIAQSVLEQGLAQEVWILITPCNPWKEGQMLLDDQLRLDMVRESVKEIPGLFASNFEFTLPKPSYTASTLRTLTATYPEREFILTIGADNWVKFYNWRDSDYIRQNYDIIVYPRKGFPTPDSFKSHKEGGHKVESGELCHDWSIVNAMTPRTTHSVTLLDCPLVEISSTQIRDMVRRGESIEHLVPPPVTSAIRNLRLYT